MLWSQETYSNLNSCLSDDMLHTQQLYVGLSARYHSPFPGAWYLALVT